MGLCEAGQDALAATLRDAAEFLDVEVNQRARADMLVANDLPGGAMEPREAMESGAAQDGVDGGGGDAQPPPDAVRPPGEHAACSADGRFLQLTGLAGAAQGAAGAVEERVFGPPSRNRRTHLVTVARETRNKRATSAWGQPDNTCSTNSARVTGSSVRYDGS